jgi:hypothetical protein
MNPKMVLLAILVTALLYFVFVIPFMEGTGPVVPRSEQD